MSRGDRFALAAYTAALYPAGPEPMMISLWCRAVMKPYLIDSKWSMVARLSIALLPSHGGSA